LIRSVGLFFLYPVEILFQPVGFLIYDSFLAQRDLGLFAKLGATGKLHTRFFGSHTSKLLVLPNNRITNRYALAKI
jgi:hypothetical protein